MNTGEDQQGLRRIIDFSRMISVAFLLLRIYFTEYPVFAPAGIRSDITDRLLRPVAASVLFQSTAYANTAILVFLCISLMGINGRKQEDAGYAQAIYLVAVGLVFFLGAEWIMLTPIRSETSVWLYTLFRIAGYLLILGGGTRLSRVFRSAAEKDVFNHANETFPQEERKLENEYSVNLPAHYTLKSRQRKSWINIINPFRGILVAGTPGAGKSYFVIRHIIDQHIRKGFTVFIYDFKYDDLSRIAYNKLLAYRKAYTTAPQFFVINFDRLSHSHRCNPLHPDAMHDITDASEASRTIMLGLNRDWIKKQGDFFVESPINFLTAVIWYLRKYENGRFCTLPHVIELMQADYDQLFPLLEQEEEIKALINPFISAYRNNAREQLEGQIASAKIGLARLVSPQLYYILSGNDFTLDVNNPEEPKIICVGNNPQKIQVYGAVLSLYIARMIKLVNRKNQQKSSLIFDEFPTIYFNGIDSLIATARCNRVATTLAVQDYSQLRKDYGSEQADVITGIIGNVISGQVSGATAKKLSESFGRILQTRKSHSISDSGTSVSRNSQLDSAIPVSTIAGLSSGEFVGYVADNPDEPISQKMFHARISNPHEELAREEAAFRDIPAVRQLDPEEIQATYARIREDITVILSAQVSGEGGAASF
ncbi:MAG: type IV secretory system conjugative DNA transfer family protein [Mucilaginibacter polytrichastri]|nr:type IV secretory system conjugative DNA transfer family protein [Mucilaginibacter polytrichastri]